MNHKQEKFLDEFYDRWSRRSEWMSQAMAELGCEAEMNAIEWEYHEGHPYAPTLWAKYEQLIRNVTSKAQFAFIRASRVSKIDSKVVLPTATT